MIYLDALATQPLYKQGPNPLPSGGEGREKQCFMRELQWQTVPSIGEYCSSVTGHEAPCENHCLLVTITLNHIRPSKNKWLKII
jgi:hypothetical protein